MRGFKDDIYHMHFKIQTNRCPQDTQTKTGGGGAGMKLLVRRIFGRNVPKSRDQKISKFPATPKSGVGNVWILIKSHRYC